VTEATAGLLRTRERTARVTNVELFFGLVYVFAVTQLSHYLLTTGPNPATGYTAGSDRGCFGWTLGSYLTYPRQTGRT
jgi:low temperature requirement protein LtrA